MSAPEMVETFHGQATAWFARRRSGQMSEAQAGELEAWLAADARHQLAFETVERLWGGFEQAREAPEVLAMRAQARAARAPRWRMAAGLAAAVVLGLGGFGVQDQLFGFKEFPDQTFRTEVGQRSTVTLPDGSVVTLNTDTVLRTRASADKRLLYLERGQAFFQVAKDKAHPFIVHAAGRTVTAVGTAFDVRAEQGRFEVTLVEGKVRVETPLPAPAPAAPTVQTTDMVAGTQFAAEGDNRWSVSRADALKETGWRTGWLTFESEPLGQVVVELGRYSDRKIVLDDPALASLPVSGRFKAGDIEAFVRAVGIYDIAPAEPGQADLVRLVQAGGEKS